MLCGLTVKLTGRRSQKGGGNLQARLQAVRLTERSVGPFSHPDFVTTTDSIGFASCEKYGEAVVPFKQMVRRVTLHAPRRDNRSVGVG